VSAQNFADLAFAEMPRLFENINRSAVVADRFVQQKQWRSPIASTSQ